MRGLPILLAALLAASSHAGDAPVDVAKAMAAKAIAEKLKQHYPATRIDQVLPSPLPGIFEVVMGRNVAFSDAEGRYFIFGHLYDMQSQRDLTAERKESLAKIDWSVLPLENSIRFVSGKGERVLSVFSDPDCPFCKKVEVELAKLDNATLYLFPFPIQSLHPNAVARSTAIWCAKDRAQAWRDALAGGKVAGKGDCENPIAANVALAERLGINGTPTMIARDGRLLPGAASAERISAWLDAGR